VVGGGAVTVRVTVGVGRGDGRDDDGRGVTDGRGLTRPDTEARGTGGTDDTGARVAGRYDTGGGDG
jgi:hypothetical protein